MSLKMYILSRGNALIQVPRPGAEIAEQIMFAEMIVNAGILPNSTVHE